MTCEDFLAGLFEARGQPDEMWRHARTCVRCRRLLDVERGLREGAKAAGGAGAEVEMSRELRDLLARERGAGRPHALLRRACYPVALTAALFVAVLALGRRPDFARFPVGLVLASIVAFLSIFTCGLTLLLTRARSGRGPGPAAGALFLFATAVVHTAFALVWVRWTADGPSRPFQIWLAENVAPILGGWVKHGPCPVLAFAVASGVFAASLWAAARTAAAAPRVAGAICGATAAVSGTLALIPFCSSHSATHVGLVHAVPLVALVLAGTALGRRVLAP